MTTPVTDIRGLACGIFKREVAELARQGKLTLPCRFLDSMLHMMPALLEDQLDRAMQAETGKHFVLLYGDCQPRMFELEARPGIQRVAGMNCCEIILGRAKYRELRSQGAFFLLPEWTERWQEVFQTYLGFNHQNAKTFMGEMHNQLLYLDTGTCPVPEETLLEVSDFCGLPFSVLPVSLDHLHQAIDDAVRKLQEADPS